MRVSISEACQGHARCSALAPDIFLIDEKGFGRVRSLEAFPEERSEDIRTAQMNCPEHAIQVRR